MPHICGARISSKGIVVNEQARTASDLTTPLLAPLWAAGLSFGRCHHEWNVPNDINLKSVFAGEEFARAARLWTHGYDFYSPTRPNVGTWYGADKGGKSFFKSQSEERSSSADRMATLLRWKGSDQSAEAVAALGRYGLGTRRSFEQFIQHSGVDTTTLTMDEHCVVQYVPWNDGFASAYSEYGADQPYRPSLLRSGEPASTNDDTGEHDINHVHDHGPALDSDDGHGHDNEGGEGGEDEGHRKGADAAAHKGKGASSRKSTTEKLGEFPWLVGAALLGALLYVARTVIRRKKQGKSR